MNAKKTDNRPINKENSPIDEPLGEDRDVVALIKIGICAELLPC